MVRPRLVCKPSRESTRLLLTFGQTELLHALLPPAASAHPRAAAMFLESLSLWVQRPLSVVVYAADQDASYALGLCDGFGLGHETLHYDVEVIDPTQRRRGLGSFRELRQLMLRGMR